MGKPSDDSIARTSGIAGRFSCCAIPIDGPGFAIVSRSSHVRSATLFGPHAFARGPRAPRSCMRLRISRAQTPRFAEDYASPPSVSAGGKREPVRSVAVVPVGRLEATAPPPTLTLTEAVRKALEENPQLAAIRQQRGIAAAAVVNCSNLSIQSRSLRATFCVSRARRAPTSRTRSFSNTKSRSPGDPRAEPIPQGSSIRRIGPNGMGNRPARGRVRHRRHSHSTGFSIVKPSWRWRRSLSGSINVPRIRSSS